MVTLFHVEHIVNEKDLPINRIVRETSPGLGNKRMNVGTVILPMIRNCGKIIENSYLLCYHLKMFQKVNSYRLTTGIPSDRVSPKPQGSEHGLHSQRHDTHLHTAAKRIPKEFEPF